MPPVIELSAYRPRRWKRWREPALLAVVAAGIIALLCSCGAREVPRPPTRSELEDPRPFVAAVARECLVGLDHVTWSPATGVLEATCARVLVHDLGTEPRPRRAVRPSSSEAIASRGRSAGQETLAAPSTFAKPETSETRPGATEAVAPGLSPAGAEVQ